METSEIPKTWGSHERRTCLGSGAFGAVWRFGGIAVKFEKGRRRLLKIEYQFLKHMHKDGTCKFVPKPIEYIPASAGQMPSLGMQLCGPSLHDVFKKHGNFTFNQITSVGNNCFIALSHLSDKGIVHRDLKPANIVFSGNPWSDDSCHVMICDFGLAKGFVNDSNVHLPKSVGKRMVGSIRYAGIDVHKGFGVSRRTDAESLLYSLAQIYLGKLPWQSNMTDKKMDEEEKRAWILEKKLTYATELSRDRVLSPILQHLQTLNWDSRPDYQGLANLLMRFRNPI